MSHIATDEHFKQAKAWVEEYVRRNPEASVVQVARAANNMRLTIPQSMVAEVRRQVRLKDARSPFNPVLRIEPKPEAPERLDALPPKPKPPPAVKPAAVAHREVDVGDPWARLGVPGPRPIAALSPPPPPPPPAAPPPRPLGDEDEDIDDSDDAPAKVPGTKKRGVRRKVTSRLPLDGSPGNMVDILECGHATTSVASKANPTRRCSTCAKDDESKELVGNLRQLVKKHGFDFVLNQLSSMEREAHE